MHRAYKCGDVLFNKLIHIYWLAVIVDGGFGWIPSDKNAFAHSTNNFESKDEEWDFFDPSDINYPINMLSKKQLGYLNEILHDSKK